MTEQVNTPELRFPEFTEKLILQKLNSVASVTMGQSPKSSNYTDDFKQMTLVQGNADLKNGKINSRIYTTEITKIAKVQDIILTVRAPVGELAIAQKEVCIGRGVCAIKANKFVYYFLEKLKINKLWTRLSQGSTFEAISGNDIKNINVTLPSKKEQTKIGDFFSKLDRQIELEEEKLKLLEQQKRGYMQKIFSQELIFKDENGNEYPNWKKRKIQDLMEVTSVKRIHQSDWQTSGVPFLRARDIVAYNKGDKIEEPLFISNDKYNAYSKISGKVEKGDLLVTGVGTIGVPFLIKDNKPLYFKDGNIIWLKNQKKLNENFLFYSFLSTSIQNYIKRVAGVGTVGTFTIINAKKTPIFEPIKEEQEKIGNFFDKVDSLIKRQSDKIELLKQRKQGLLQKMFI